jgi:hypothetical protein
MDEADPPSPKQETNMNDDLLADEELFHHCRRQAWRWHQFPDGLGRLRNFVQGISASEAESISARRRPPNGGLLRLTEKPQLAID